MKVSFAASICVHGLQGGAVYLLDDGFLFRCQKASIEVQYQKLHLSYTDIKSISKGKRVLFVPTTVIETKSGRTYRFLIFRRKKFQGCIERQLASFGQAHVVQSD